MSFSLVKCCPHLLPKRDTSYGVLSKLCDSCLGSPQKGFYKLNFDAFFLRVGKVGFGLVVWDSAENLMVYATGFRIMFASLWSFSVEKIFVYHLSV